MQFIYMIVAIYVAVLAGKSADAAGSYLNVLRSNIASLAQPDRAELIRRSSIPQPMTNSEQQASYRGGCSQNYQFDYLMLTLQWGPGFCSTSERKCIKSENRIFTVHGMWPQMKSGEEKGFCCFDNTFDFRQIGGLESDLDRYWFSYYTPSNKGFWSHEWLKHGTCARDVKQLQGERLFFRTTLGIVKSLPVLETLRASNILPADGGKPYAAGDIIKSLKKITKSKEVRVNCDLEHNQSVPVLTGIGVCLDKSLSFIDCPTRSKRCQGQVIFRNTVRRSG